MPVTTLAVLAAAGGFLERYQAWATDDMDAAVERVGDVGFIAAYLSDDQPGHGAEVYSICRTWPVGDRAFVRRFVGPGGAGAPRRRGRTIMGWYAVRIPMYDEHVGIYDDRITLWRARSAETACRLARGKRAGWAESCSSGRSASLTSSGWTASRPTRDRSAISGESGPIWRIC